VEIRSATASDADNVATMASALAQSFSFSSKDFHATYARLLAAEHACLLVALESDDYVGYLLGFEHLTFYANGPVGLVEEILVREERRAHGVGRQLMDRFENWAAGRGCTLVGLATRRAAPFYLALGYEESATYFRKTLDARPRFDSIDLRRDLP
jgi:GNAT superfamily N-acetyltransferase